MLLDREHRSKAGDTFLKIVEKIKTGLSIWMFPEGTRSGYGPVGKFKSGALHTALLAKVPIIPLYISGKNAKLIDNWDRYMIIKPFSKVGVKLGECFNIPDNLSEDEFKNVKIQLQNLMVKEQQELDKEFGLEKIDPEKFEESKAYRRLKREGKI